MYIGAMARQSPDKPAVIQGDEVISYAELDARSNQLAQLFQAWGLRVGDGIAVLIGNEPRFCEFYWAALRSGLYFTPINTHLAPSEMQYIADNCDAKVFVTSNALRDAAKQFAHQLPKATYRIITDGQLDGFMSYPHVASDMPTTPIADEREGQVMLYSSGTTGRPKGVRQALSGARAGEGMQMLAFYAQLLGILSDDRHLCVGPLYHIGPIAFSLLCHRLGTTVVLMPRFEAENTLQHIERYRITSSFMVPTHFVRLLQLPDDVRRRYDLSSLRVVIHAAAPCPLDVKRQMLEWWGNLIELYSGTEGGTTMVRPDEWLKHPGTVGRHVAGGKIWILDEQGNEVPAGQTGLVYFEATTPFEYFKDEAKTAETYRGKLFTLGDIGYLDAEGYLYLTDRQSHTIISGGVNIYPAEVEGALITHPAIADVAVIGIPEADMGEQVKAIVQLRDGFTASDELRRDIIEFCRAHIAHFKCPRSVDFVAQLPRSPAGKLLKRELKARYWQ